MSAVTSDGAPPGSRYGDQRPYVVAEQLDDLHGPTTGVVELDHSLDWSARVRYDLDNPRRFARMYETVLREASSFEDLARWLDGATLVRIWPTLVLPHRMRELWEARFPELMTADRSAA